MGGQPLPCGSPLPLSPLGSIRPFPLPSSPPLLLAPSLLHALSPLVDPPLFRGFSCCPVPQCPPSFPPSSADAIPVPAPLVLTPRLGQVWLQWGKRDWPLGGISPAVDELYQPRFRVPAPLAPPLPPNGGSAPFPCPLPVGLPPLSPSLPLCTLVGGLCRFWVLPPTSCISPFTKGVRSCSGGAPPTPLSCMPCVGSAHY